jgi:PhnB protein
MSNPKSKPKPARQSVTAHLIVRDADRAIRFYTEAFGAVEVFRLVEPGGKVGHCELEIGGSRIMLCDEYPDFGAVSAAALGGSPIRLQLYVDEADAAMRRAVAAGATVLRPAKDEFYGDRSGMVLDPFGLSWTVAAHVEDVSPKEMQRRFTAVCGG